MDNISGEEQGWGTALMLAEALPFIQTYNRSVVVIKHGGHIMEDTEITKQFAADCVLLKMLGLHPVIVHGGGPQISAVLKRLGIESQFIDGHRVTDVTTMEVAEMVLSGLINKEIANQITLAGREADVRGVGLSGKDARLITVEKHAQVDLGFVGKPKAIDPKLIEALIFATGQHYIPVIAPIGISDDGQTYNINADTVAGALAVALHAKRLLLLTDVPGVLNKEGELIRQIAVQEARSLVVDGVAAGGMMPKLKTAIDAVEAGLNATVIMDGRRAHAILVELFTEHGSGTLVYR